MMNMTFRQFENLTMEKQEEVLREWIDNSDYLEKIFKEGHADELHCNTGPDVLLNRTLSEFKNCSAFSDKEDALFLIRETLYYEAKNIVRWLLSDERESFLKIDCCMDEDEMIGKGIDTNLNEKTTPYITVILQRDYSSYRNDGRFFCFVKTAFPNIEHLNARDTGKNYSKLAEHMIQNLKDPLDRIFWGARLSGMESYINIDYKNGKNITMVFEVMGRKCSLSFNDNSTGYRYPFVKIQTENGWEKLDKVQNINEYVKNEIMDRATKLNSLCERIYNDRFGNHITNIKEEFDKLNIKSYEQKIEKTEEQKKEDLDEVL